jgi:hypothetical protein
MGEAVYYGLQRRQYTPSIDPAFLVCLQIFIIGDSGAVKRKSFRFVEAEHCEAARGQQLDRIFVRRAAAQEAPRFILDDDQRKWTLGLTAGWKDEITEAFDPEAVFPDQALDGAKPVL